MTIVTPPPTIARDRYGRPMVVPPAGGKPVAYTRCTSYIDVIEDKFNLQKWMQRMVALGLASRPDLLLSVTAHRDDKKQLDRICDDAREASAASAAATTGTALHALTELIDRGDTLPVIPDTATADLNAYRTATADLKAVHIEQFCVLDTLQIGGTPDRVVSYQGRRYIADIKTGSSVDWGALKIAMPLAIYARSHTYHPGTHERGIHEADTRRGIVIHLPAGTATCTLHWVDLDVGWEAVKVATKVREQRRIKAADLYTPFGPTLTPAKRIDLYAAIDRCLTADGVRNLWAEHADEWTDDLTAHATAHITTLPDTVR